MKALQEKVGQFVERYGLETSVEARLFDLTAEVGELAKEVLKGSRYGKSPLTLGDEWGGEMGDVFFALICLANSTEVDLDAALMGVLEKYQRRLGDKGDAGSGQ